MPRVYISVGSNIDRERYITAGLEALQQRFGQLMVSPVYESKAVGFDGDAFYNLVVGFDTGISLEELATALREIEAQNDRDRTMPKFSDRTLDLDILTYGNAVGQYGHIELPRDEIDRYAFVLKPLSDLAPDARHPVSGETYAVMWRNFSDKSQTVEEVSFEWPLVSCH